jgi:hypothetical protein
LLGGEFRQSLLAILLLAFAFFSAHGFRRLAVRR